MGMKKVIFVGCIFLVGNSYAQSSMNCGEKLSEKSINYKECLVGGLNSNSNAGMASNQLVGQSANAVVVGVQKESVSRDTSSLVSQIKKTDPVEGKLSESSYITGVVERRVFSCEEMSKIRYWAKNPNNSPGKKVLGQTGVVLGVVDSYGWYEIPFTITDSNMKEVVVFGGANAWRNAVYKNGVFHNWVGFPPDDGKNNLSPGWGWNFSQIGFCENRV